MYFSPIGPSNITNVRVWIISFFLVIAIVVNTSIFVNASFDTNIRTMSDQDIHHADTIAAWNNLTTQLGIKEKFSPPEFSRTYALVHISMYDSLLAAAKGKENHLAFDNKSFYVSSMAEAASSVLIYLFPNHTDEITELKSKQISQFQNYDENNSPIKKALMLGHQVALAVIDYAKNDNSNLIWTKQFLK